MWYVVCGVRGTFHIWFVSFVYSAGSVVDIGMESVACDWYLAGRGSSRGVWRTVSPVMDPVVNVSPMTLSLMLEQ